MQTNSEETSGIAVLRPPNVADKKLYVGNLDPRVNELLIQQIFSTAGEVVNVKIIHDRAQYQNGGFNYGFVEFLDHRAAESALQNLNGRKIFSSEIRVNWAFTGSGSSNQKEDTASHAHIFVGDLSAEVNDAVLAKAFSAFGSMSDARVMWDLNSGKSRGYGFVSFREKSDAEQAIAQMNGEWLGSRPIRVNWANQRTTNPAPTANILTGPSLSYEATLSQASSFNTTVYVGNLAPNTTQQDLAALFQRFGFLVEVRVQADRGYGFVKLDTHENAAMAIVSMQGAGLHGRALKCSWGKDRNADASAAAGYYPQFTMPVQQGYGYGYPPANISLGYLAQSAADSGYQGRPQGDIPPGVRAPGPTPLSAAVGAGARDILGGGAPGPAVATNGAAYEAYAAQAAGYGAPGYPANTWTWDPTRGQYLPY